MKSLYWYNEVKNFGDALNPEILKYIFNIHCQWAPPSKCDICAIGSILDLFFTDQLTISQRVKRIVGAPVLVWGGGFIRPEQDKRYLPIRKMNIRAVRGKLTRDRIKKYLKLDSCDIALGDPGLLASRLIDVHLIDKKYDLGIIPHYVDADNANLKNINVKNSIVIDVRAPLETVLVQIAQCKAILSSAMHGLIAADSFGVPNMRMVLSDKIIGGDYKFDDYYSAFDIKTPEKLILTSDVRVNSTDFIFDNYAITPHMVNDTCNNLLTSFLLKGEK